LEERTAYEDAVCDNNTDDYPELCKGEDED
jgi:hypothetical protein